MDGRERDRQAAKGWAMHQAGIPYISTLTQAWPSGASPTFEDPNCFWSEEK